MPRPPQYTRWTARRKPEWLRSLVLGVVALAVGIYLGLRWVFSPPATNGADARANPPDAVPAGIAPDPADPPSRAAAEPAGAPRIRPGTQLVYRTTYRETGKTAEEISAPTRDMVNLSEELLRRLYPQYRIEEFTDDRVVLVATVDGPDPATLAEEQKEYRTIRAVDGVVTVFAGRRHRQNQPVLRTTDVRVDLLPEEVRAALVEGIEVRGDEELARYLEGLSG